ncbi:hypothetical protein EOPP23_15600 [Endozoicomonas sp. OPT23]|uniref:TetR/AcrR family transcriptional regulator n=1 Tax=Endozoicomonas sp. OPT23 TaxID=2072845 RepID=UPI00129B3386|nr:TetR/AcrR family transcriptional regulator [Endozoicomonas sp. OPT23]MRI34414.1 hypothetical protein [Endozoicomonas sp. OPT23]
MRTDKRLISAEALEKLRQTIISNFADVDFNHVGIRDICQQSNVSHKTVYKYFGSKEELLFACVQPDLKAMCDLAVNRVEQAVSIDAKVSAFANVFFDFYQQNPAIARIVYLQIPLINWITNDKFVQREVHQLFAAIITLGRKQVQNTHELTSEELVDAILGILTRLIVKQVSDKHHESDMADTKKTFILLVKRLLA